MVNDTEKRRSTRRQYRLAALFSITALLAVPVVLISNEMRSYERDKEAVGKLSQELTRKWDVTLDRDGLDTFGLTDLTTSSVRWRKTPLGRYTRLPFQRRIASVSIHSSECNGMIPPSVLELDGLEDLVLRGSFRESSVENFRRLRPAVNVAMLEIPGLDHARGPSYPRLTQGFRSAVSNWGLNRRNPVVAIMVWVLQ